MRKRPRNQLGQLVSEGGRIIGGDYPRIQRPEHPRSVKGYVYEHVLVVECALGRPLETPHEVHHVNGDKHDNRGCNLVVCEDKAYHALLHRRQRALEACGHADWLRCYYCKRYDEPAAIVRWGKAQGHRQCRSEYRRDRRIAERLKIGAAFAGIGSIGERFGVSDVQAGNILTGRSWTHLTRKEA